MHQAFTLLYNNQGIFFSRELELVKSRSYDVEYADLPARELFPVNNEGGLGITSITYRTYDKRGTAQIINAYAHDLPRSDVSGKETTIPVKEIGTAFGFTIKEIASSQLTGKGLDQRRANASRRAVEEKINDIALYGDDDHGLPGLLNNPNIPKATATDPGNGTEFVNKTPDQMLADLNAAVAAPFILTKKKERVNRLLLPVAQWNLAATTPRASGDSKSVLTWFVENSEFIASREDVIAVNELAGAGSGDTDIMVAYDANPEKLELEIPYELQYLPVQEKGLELLTPGICSIGGLNIYYPLSLNIVEGI